MLKNVYSFFSKSFLATEIQNIQFSDGDIARGIDLSMYMTFPKLFTCPTFAAKTFKSEFELNIVVIFEDNYVITENFPLQLVRYKD